MQLEVATSSKSTCRRTSSRSNSIGASKGPAQPHPGLTHTRKHKDIKDSVVDVANIGANYEHRTEFSPAGPTRTLKLGLTDGHQLVFGFEYSPLPEFSVNIARGTKIVVENVPVRHGLLMLAPDNCQLLETSSDRPGRSNGQAQQPNDVGGVSVGAYSAALVTSQFNSSQQQASATPTIRSQQPAKLQMPGTNAIPNGISRTNTVRSVQPSSPPSAGRMSSNSTSESAKSSVIPSVFVDMPPSDEDVDSDTTDPMVEHLFYSPKTPRYPAGSDISTTTPAPTRENVSRKRPRSPSADQAATARLHARQNPVDSAVNAVKNGAAVQTSKILQLGQDRNTSAIASTPIPPLDLTQPFQYFTAKLSPLSTRSTTIRRFQIRACIKSVVGFQFNTGRYQLRVSVEDCTATREADVAEAFVTRLMGVPCSEFLQTMKTKVQVAHGWAATMQFALMNLEGVMTFEKGTSTSTPGSAPLLLIDCRDFQSTDTRKLLSRVKASLSKSNR
ncbi:unnamed protein product [Phytophthora lilii]|uniref:RecQ-mediated genome instability protein 1 n=1 Tax=Phytophthora lilii TaxID=2077276 RepID=A0A9W6X8P9_9STRA|nr:unnamed protein product [Phytophthora lilii]